MPRMNKQVARQHVREALVGYSKLAYPDASEIPEDFAAGEAMEQRANARAREILDFMIEHRLI